MQVEDVPKIGVQPEAVLNTDVQTEAALYRGMQSVSS